LKKVGVEAYEFRFLFSGTELFILSRINFPEFIDLKGFVAVSVVALCVLAR